MQSPIKLHVIIGSTRKSRFSEKPAHWIYEQAKKLPNVEVELLDLRDYPMPFFEEPVSPSYKKEPYTNEVVKNWTNKIAEADGYIVVTPEYNHGYPAVLKNAIDYVSQEWNNKPIAFISYGSVGGARAIEQLRQVAIELQMAPIRNSINIPWSVYMTITPESVPVEEDLFEPLNGAKDNLLKQLLWWASALKEAREKTV